MKGWLDPITVEKIHILGGGYQKEILAQIPAENLPKAFGGSCECPGEGGCMLSDEGPWTNPEWARPPKWQLEPAKKPEIINNENINSVTTTPAAPVPAPVSAAQAPVQDDEIKAAPAPQ